MAVIEQLIAFINSNEQHTHIKQKGESVYLVKDAVGKAILLYGQDRYGKTDTVNFQFDFDKGLKIIAILSDGICYIVEKYIFNQWGTSQNKESLPSGVVWFRDYIKELNDKLANEVFPKFYKELVPTLLKTTYWDDNDLYQWARYTLLDKPPFQSEFNAKSMFTANDVVNILCGFVEQETAFEMRLNADFDIYNVQKNQEMAIQKYIDTHNVVEDYEVSIINSIKNITAKTVAVYFEKDGKQASGKIAPEVIKRKCLYRDDFSSYDFNNRVEGQWVLNTLNAASFRGIENNLYVKDITALTYRGKEIYRRKEISV